MPVKGLQLLPFVAALAAAGAALAQDQPRSMLDRSFDLKRAILSPAPLGPPSRLEPPAVAAAPATTSSTDAKPAVAASKAAAPRKLVSSKPRQKTAASVRKPKSSPLNAYAHQKPKQQAIQRQSWPCTGGGICAWTQPN
jgi:hypothetical protein